ncbi:MAG: histidine kinase [Bacteroidota bacterium]
MSVPLGRWTRNSIVLFVVVALVLLGYWGYWWQLGLVPYTVDGGADLGGFLRWLLGYVFLLALVLGAAWLNHRLAFRKLVSQKARPHWSYYSWLLVLWLLLFELFQNLNGYAAEVIIENWFVSLLCMLLIATLTLALDQPEIRRKRAELEQAKVEAELHNLRAQLHPHFLFNTLNTIYSEALQQDQDDLATLIGELSGLLRFSFKHAKQTTVTLQEELDFLRPYLHLQLARLTPAQQEAVELDLLTEPPQRWLPPLLLIPFVENAFVHGVHDGPDFHLRIKLRVMDDQLQLQIANSKPTRQASRGSGTGISNTRQRLERLYQNRYLLEEEQTPETYRMHLKFPLSLSA